MVGQQVIAASAIDTLEVGAKRAALIDLAKLETPCLGMVGCLPDDGPIYVMDDGNDIRVGSEIDALRAFAHIHLLLVSDPVCCVKTPGQAEVWESRMTVDGVDSGSIATGASEEEAWDKMRSALWDLCGTSVCEIKGWAQNQDAFARWEAEALSAGTTGAGNVAKQRQAPFMQGDWKELYSLPLAKLGPHMAAFTGPTKVRRKAALAALAEPRGLATHLDGGAKQSAWRIAVFEDDGVTYANHHDLVYALRMGLDIGSVTPWPNDIAHNFLILQELRNAMKVRGFVQLDDFDPTKWVRLRVSLPEFTPSITGESPAKKQKREFNQEKPAWPPLNDDACRVVIVLDKARLAFEEEPEWEIVMLRKPVACTGLLWVEREGPRAKKSKAGKRTAC